MLSKANACRRDFDATKYVFFDKSELLEKYIEIWDKVSNTIKKGFDNEPVYNEKYLRTKIKSYDVKISTHFYREETPKEVGFRLEWLRGFLIFSLKVSYELLIII